MSATSFALFRGKLMGAKKFTALKALALAEEAHKGVVRKDGVTPYVEHPAKVASMLLELGIEDDDILAVAILHDVLEDCKDNAVKEKIYKTFNDDICSAVGILTKSEGYKNEEYYGKIKKNPIAALVKLADRTHNLSTLYNFTEEKKKAYIQETKDFVYDLIQYAQHNYYEYADQLRMFDLWIESLVKNIEVYLN